MSAACILVVNDDPVGLCAMRAHLVARGYMVVTATSSEEALARIALWKPDLVIFDVALPGIPGLEACPLIRVEASAPVLVLSTHDEIPLKVRALDLGADDYVTKPFAVDELLARVRALLRRPTRGHETAIMLEAGDLRVDLDARCCTRAGKALHLTRREFDVLAYLVRYAGKVVTHQELLEAVWGPGFAAETQYLRVFVNRLRSKLEDQPARPDHILTELGVGYRCALSTGTGRPVGVSDR
jgi:two-component system KDP operon response regulator KdpE